MIYFLLIVGEVEIQVPNFAVGIWVDAGGSSWKKRV